MKDTGIGSEKIIRRKRDGELEYQPDDLTIEEPLEIRIGDRAIATTMRTPGHDDELAAGFLLSEAIVRQREEIQAIAASSENVINIRLAPAVTFTPATAQRFGTISSSCGLCGKMSIEFIRQQFPSIELPAAVKLPEAVLLDLPGKLRAAQSNFARTGGIHAAGIF